MSSPEDRTELLNHLGDTIFGSRQHETLNKWKHGTIIRNMQTFLIMLTRHVYSEIGSGMQKFCVIWFSNLVLLNCNNSHRWSSEISTPTINLLQETGVIRVFQVLLKNNKTTIWTYLVRIWAMYPVFLKRHFITHWISIGFVLAFLLRSIIKKISINQSAFCRHSLFIVWSGWLKPDPASWASFIYWDRLDTFVS